MRQLGGRTFHRVECSKKNTAPRLLKGGICAPKSQKFVRRGVTPRAIHTGEPKCSVMYAQRGSLCIALVVQSSCVLSVSPQGSAHPNQEGLLVLGSPTLTATLHHSGPFSKVLVVARHSLSHPARSGRRSVTSAGTNLSLQSQSFQHQSLLCCRHSIFSASRSSASLFHS